MTSSANLARLRSALEELHEGDEHQLQVVYSSDQRIIVEAPAGYGKTKTIVSKLAHMLASGDIAYPKKILALTFSVNAAYKMKKDIISQVPRLIGDTIGRTQFDRTVLVSNYHGFSRRVLARWGYLLAERLRSINSLRVVEDSKEQGLRQLRIGIDAAMAGTFLSFSEAVKGADEKRLIAAWDDYVGHVLGTLVPNGYITHNAILALVIEIFRHKAEVGRFYRSYLPAIVVDEFQDTNLLSWWLLQALISPSTKLTLVGDPLQRIYGFIGAIPNLMERAREDHNMTLMSLKNNYRFRDNESMLLLDRNIRKNAENPENPSINQLSSIDFNLLADQDDEAQWLVERLNMLRDTDEGAKITILVKQRGKNADALMDSLRRNEVDFFYGLFSDEDPEYVRMVSWRILSRVGLELHVLLWRR